MRLTAVAMAILISASVAGARQAPVEYVISGRVFVANPPNSGSVQVLAAPTFRTSRQQVLTMDLTTLNGLSVAVTPSDLGAGKVGLRVVVESRRDGRTAASTFDLLTGVDTAAATIALRDADGTFMVDQQGRPLFVSFETTIRQR